MSRDPGPFNIRRTFGTYLSDLIYLTLMWVLFTVFVACAAMTAGCFVAHFLTD